MTRGANRLLLTGRERLGGQNNISSAGEPRHRGLSVLTHILAGVCASWAPLSATHRR